jgi:dipeptidase E
MDLLLLSNSKTADGRYLPHAVEPLRAVLNGRRRAAFIPFAGVTVAWDEYLAKVRAALAPLDLDITSVHTTADPVATVKSSDIILVGGGNTFQLLKLCREKGLLDAIRQQAHEGAVYMGWSAGANLACPTVCTTNDMPIVDPHGFDALNLVSFQINPHFTDELPAGHQGETRSQRIAEFLVAHPQACVVGLPEGDWLHVSRDRVLLCGPHPATVFCAGRKPEPRASGTVIQAQGMSS